MSILTKETYQSSAKPRRAEEAPWAAGTDIYWLLLSTWTRPAWGGCGATATVQPRSQLVQEEHPSGNPGFYQAPGLRTLHPPSCTQWELCRVLGSVPAMVFVVEEDTDRYGSPSWSGDDPVDVVCLLFGCRLNHWDPTCWIIPCSAMINVLKWCSMVLGAQQGHFWWALYSNRDSRDLLHNPCMILIRIVLHDTFAWSRKSRGNSQLEECFSCKAAPNTIKSHTVKITSGCGILGWEGMKLNRGRKAKERRRIFHSSKTIICYWCRNILTLSMSQNTLAFHLPMLQQPFFSISVWPQAFYA